MLKSMLKRKENVMTDQDTKPTHIEAEQSPNFGSIVRRLTWAVPLVIVIVLVGIVLLALLGPAVGNVYSYMGSAL
jgi:hypothetical protein